MTRWRTVAVRSLLLTCNYCMKRWNNDQQNAFAFLSGFILQRRDCASFFCLLRTLIDVQTLHIQINSNGIMDYLNYRLVDAYYAYELRCLKQ